MTQLNYSHTIIIFFLIAFLVITLACDVESRKAAADGTVFPAGQDLLTAQGTNSVEFRGISFSYNEGLQTEVVPEETKAIPLDKSDDKPDSASPKHILFHFKGAYGDKFEGAFFSPAIHVYLIERYKEVLHFSTRELTSFEGRLTYLRDVLEKEQTAFTDDAPFVEFVDAEHAFIAKIRYIRFGNGRGILYLTQFNREKSLVNNKGLTYVFQGLTDDGKYYISATFPVSSNLLVESYEETRSKFYTLPEYAYGGNEDEDKKNAAEYKQYLKEIGAELDASPPNTFMPHLQYFDEIIKSLRLDPPNKSD